jgi:hypothetical protein
MSGETLAFLIADDHPMVREALASALGQAFAGAAIAMAGSLPQVQANLEREPEPDALLLDLDMPGMDGLTGLALAALRPSDRADHRRLRGARGCGDTACLRVRRLGLHRQVGIAGGNRRHGPCRVGRRDLRAG